MSEFPTEVNQANTGKVDLEKVASGMREVGEEMGVIHEGAPTIRRELTPAQQELKEKREALVKAQEDLKTNKADPQVEIPPETHAETDEDNPLINRYEGAYAKFYDTLPDEDKVSFNNYASVEDKLPKSIDLIGLMKMKKKFTDIYFLELASGPYIFRALSAAEDLQIKAIEGLKNIDYANRVLSVCTIAPHIGLDTVDTELAAGTKDTLYEQILMYSDFATSATQSVKL